MICGMVRFSASRRLECLIGLVALIYSALLVTVSECAPAHTDQSRSHQHRQSEPGSSDQNIFCGWACQITADAVEANGVLLIASESVSEPVDLISRRRCLVQLSSGVQTRAPPSILFATLG